MAGIRYSKCLIRRIMVATLSAEAQCFRQPVLVSTVENATFRRGLVPELTPEPPAGVAVKRNFVKIHRECGQPPRGRTVSRTLPYWTSVEGSFGSSGHPSWRSSTSKYSFATVPVLMRRFSAMMTAIAGARSLMCINCLRLLRRMQQSVGHRMTKRKVIFPHSVH